MFLNKFHFTSLAKTRRHRDLALAGHSTYAMNVTIHHICTHLWTPEFIFQPRPEGTLDPFFDEAEECAHGHSCSVRRGCVHQLGLETAPNPTALASSVNSRIIMASLAMDKFDDVAPANTLSRNPLNAKYQEILSANRAQFQQCTYYMPRKKRQCAHACAIGSDLYCSLHSPEGLRLEREKGRKTRADYNEFVDAEMENIMRDLIDVFVSSIFDHDDAVDEEIGLDTLVAMYRHHAGKHIAPKGGKKSKRVSAPKRMANPLSMHYLQRFEAEKVVWTDIFEDITKPLHIDIGCARGNFILRLAGDSTVAPNYNFLGCEIRSELVDDANGIVRERQLVNIHFLPGNFAFIAKDLFASLASAGICIKTISIQFPDPWRRKKHRKRLIVQRKLVHTIAQAMEPGGMVYFISDVHEVETSIRNTFKEAEEYFVLMDPLEAGYPFHGIPTERSLVCEHEYRAVWFGVACRK